LINLIAGNSSEELAKKISKKLKANLIKSEVKVFPDGESKITLSGKLSKNKTIVVQSIYPDCCNSIPRICPSG
jgi:ribose-phosphate pyrophosphokinase